MLSVKIGNLTLTEKGSGYILKNNKNQIITLTGIQVMWLRYFYEAEGILEGFKLRVKTGGGYLLSKTDSNEKIEISFGELKEFNNALFNVKIKI